MILEAAEQRCLRYLAQVSNPFVSFDSLLSYVRQEEVCADLDEHEFLHFVRHHALLHVLEPVEIAQNPAHAQMFEMMGMPTGMRVALAERMPSPQEISRQMREQLGLMMQALETALCEAEEAENMERIHEINRMLSTAEKLGEQLEQF